MAHQFAPYDAGEAKAGAERAATRYLAARALDLEPAVPRVDRLVDRSARHKPTCACSNSRRRERPPRGLAPHRRRAFRRRVRPRSWSNACVFVSPFAGALRSPPERALDDVSGPCQRQQIREQALTYRRLARFWRVCEAWVQRDRQSMDRRLQGRMILLDDSPVGIISCHRKPPRARAVEFPSGECLNFSRALRQNKLIISVCWSITPTHSAVIFVQHASEKKRRYLRTPLSFVARLETFVSYGTATEGGIPKSSRSWWFA